MYEGNFENDSKSGFGELYEISNQNQDKLIYRGNWKLNYKHGNGE
jgi:hypothetical protein